MLVSFGFLLFESICVLINNVEKNMLVILGGYDFIYNVYLYYIVLDWWEKGMCCWFYYVIIYLCSFCLIILCSE